jgi:hypothetical protein
MRSFFFMPFDNIYIYIYFFFVSFFKIKILINISKHKNTQNYFQFYVTLKHFFFFFQKIKHTPSEKH